jgi:hypothetical protein
LRRLEPDGNDRVVRRDLCAPVGEPAPVPRAALSAVGADVRAAVDDDHPDRHARLGAVASSGPYVDLDRALEHVER